MQTKSKESSKQIQLTSEKTGLIESTITKNRNIQAIDIKDISGDLSQNVIESFQIDNFKGGLNIGTDTTQSEQAKNHNSNGNQFISKDSIEAGMDAICNTNGKQSVIGSNHNKVGRDLLNNSGTIKDYTAMDESCNFSHHKLNAGGGMVSNMQKKFSGKLNNNNTNISGTHNFAVSQIKAGQDVYISEKLTIEMLDSELIQRIVEHYEVIINQKDSIINQMTKVNKLLENENKALERALERKLLTV